MKKLKIGILDLVHKGPTKSMYARVMHHSLAGIMPSVLATWAEQAGHDVTYVVYTGLEDIEKEIPRDADIVFISAFTQAAQLAYAISNMLRQKNIITALGGPHARCYPQDASKYFDYVFGFTSKEVFLEVLGDCQQHRPFGKRVKADSQPTEFPSVRDRWKFIDATLKKAPFIKIVGMMGSTGCPYTCVFCIDSEIPYKTLDFDIIRDDLRFLLTKFKRPRVGWHDPNFGIRFNEIMSIIEEAIPPNSIDFIAESSMAILTEPNLKRMKAGGFKAALPGVESWYDMGGKSKAKSMHGMTKMMRVSDHINQIMEYIPYLQANFVFGLDTDEGPEPFELTKKFVDRSPAAFPGYSLLTAFGQAAPLNLQYQREGRLLPFPFHTLNNHVAMNIKPKNYEWPEFYKHVLDVTQHTFSSKAIRRRFVHSRMTTVKLMNLVRAFSNEGMGRIKLFKNVIQMLEKDRKFRDFFEGETTELPEFYRNYIKHDLGPMWDWLPEGSLVHDELAYMKEVDTQKVAAAL
jgi:B12 binding domain